MDAAERSSSNDLSSAPNSDIEASNKQMSSSTIVVSRNGMSHQQMPNLSGVKPDGMGSGTITDRQEPVPKQRKPRKKKDSDVAATPTEKKEKGTRRSRGGSTAGSTRKKLKTETGAAANPLQNIAIAIASESAYPRPSQHSIIDLTTQTSSQSEASKVTQNGFLSNNPAISPQKPLIPHYNPTPPPLPQPVSVPRSMAYDPVRSLTTPRNNELPHNLNTIRPTLDTPPRHVYNPSMSPAISSIINPPEIASAEPRAAPPQPYQSQVDVKVQPQEVHVKPAEDSTTMEVDPPMVKGEPSKKPNPEVALVKPAAKPRAKEQPPPLPTGSGLLSSSLFGGDSGIDASKMSNDKGTSIVLHVDLSSSNNKVINFARMAEEKYGFAALYPRQAAQKERLAKVAAAGAALERAGAGIKGTPAGDSGDEDVSVDIDRDSENDADVAMSGMNGTGEAVNSGTDGPVPKRRKRKDEYDADDPFVDDSEMLWEAQAAASKDGFFVYCGPLVPEGEKPTVERADGTVKRGRGRGRGGGPGSRGGRGAAAAAARDAEGASGRGGGPGSRGGGITRKPRITKAERAQRELEKKQREQMAVLAAKPPNYQP